MDGMWVSDVLLLSQRTCVVVSSMGCYADSGV